MPTRSEIVRSTYIAYADGDRERIEPLLAADLTFSAPPDVGIDRDRYFERCWPGAGTKNVFDLVRLIEDGEEVVVTYEARRTDGSRFRNTEIFRIAGDQVHEIEVYFGWDL